MPALIVKSLAQKTGKSTKEVERMWSKAKEAAKENGPQRRNYFGFMWHHKY